MVVIQLKMGVNKVNETSTWLLLSNREKKKLVLNQ